MTTPNNQIPEVPEATLDPAAGLNSALNTIDALLNTAVLEVGTNDPPVTPADGDMYVVGVGTGDWLGEDDNLARYVQEGDFWQFFEAGAQVRIVLALDDWSIWIWTESNGWQRWPVLDALTNAADDTAASGAGVAVGQVYRNGSVLQIRVT